MGYQNGFEDAIELCLSEIVESKSKKEAVKKIKGLLGIMKSNKFERIRQKLGTF